MPRRRSARGRRRGGAQRPRPPIGAPTTAASAPAAPQTPAAQPVTAEPAREPSVTRFSSRDYSYVRRELVRISILAAGIIVTIVVLSFFLP